VLPALLLRLGLFCRLRECRLARCSACFLYAHASLGGHCFHVHSLDRQRDVLGGAPFLHKAPVAVGFIAPQPVIHMHHVERKPELAAQTQKDVRERH
jgi:hypothetical protein